jgi:hypothetical protein
MRSVQLSDSENEISNECFIRFDRCLDLVESVTLYCEKCQADTKHDLGWERKKPLIGKPYRDAVCKRCGTHTKYYKRW